MKKKLNKDLTDQINLEINNGILVASEPKEVSESEEGVEDEEE